MLVSVCCLKIDELEFRNIFAASKVVMLCSVVLFLLCLLNRIAGSIQLTESLLLVSPALPNGAD